ncbi:TonB-dependent receptor [Marinobacter sp. EhC06]|jgi:iron complex outermembrane receptor protein|uniref:TonB-dependent receptor plug domain-containing protein n=1 Tax=Marinobacter TaxID=2742 RepID=UPI0007D8D336|nr:MULTISPECIES: TonB-dependent receptor [unclassified Marinobacter]OAN92837.1 TonB-dependent receptor [Marinobacter sp. EhN04]OAN96362.1 TonB-dependent receptor [Marinobacter sp. EhC06]
MHQSTKTAGMGDHRPLATCLGISLALSALLPATALGQTDTPDFMPGLLALEGEQSEIPEVLTTTRLRQSKLRVPGTTTIITGDMIRDLGIMNLVEAFRLVPGMVVGHWGSTNPVATYHGTSQYEQRRLQVQIDGRTAYRISLADVDWLGMPVALENIERIEVSRGPNSAAYGINAFLGSINIITRSPQDTAGVEAYTSVGSRGHLRTFTSVGDTDADKSWRLSYEKRKSNGFDSQIDGGQEIPFHDGHDINNFNFDSVFRIDRQHSIDVRAGVLDGVNEEDLEKSGKLGATTNPDIIMDDYYLHVRFDGATSPDHFYHIQASYQNQRQRQRWSVSAPAAEINALLPTGFPPFPEDQGPFIADLNEDLEETRQEIEFQDTIIFSDQFKLVSGLGYRKDSFESETFFNGKGKNYQSRVFANAEYSPFRWLTFNAGGNWERTTTTDEDYFSPRAAANFILSNNHALRFVFSRAVRTPDAFEQNPDWSYTPTNVQPPFEALDGQKIEVESILDPTTSTYGQKLEEEWITSREISYFGQFHLESALLSVEVRYFNDDFHDMISGVINEEEWYIANNVDLEQEGVELETSLEFSGTKLRATYAYLEQEGRYTGDPAALPVDKQERAVDLLARLSARDSGSFAWIQDLPKGFMTSAAMYWTNEVRDTRFERADFRLARRVDKSDYSYMLALTIQHYLNHKPWISPDNRIEDQNQFFVEAGIRF